MKVSNTIEIIGEVREIEEAKDVIFFKIEQHDLKTNGHITFNVIFKNTEELILFEGENVLVKGKLIFEESELICVSNQILQLKPETCQEYDSSERNQETVILPQEKIFQEDQKEDCSNIKNQTKEKLGPLSFFRFEEEKTPEKLVIEKDESDSLQNNVAYCVLSQNDYLKKEEMPQGNTQKEITTNSENNFFEEYDSKIQGDPPKKDNKQKRFSISDFEI